MYLNLQYQKFFVTIACLFVSCYTQSQNIRREFRNISVENGLPDGTVKDLLQDNVGYVWVATFDGLAKYDSHKFTTYKQDGKDSTTISSNQLFSLYEDWEGQLWIGTKNSLELYDRQNDNFTSFFFVNRNKNFVEKVPVTDIVQYSDSLYLVATDGGGVYVFNPRRKEYLQYKAIYKNNDTIPVTQIANICIDRKNRVWLASIDAGLTEFDFSSYQIRLLPDQDSSHKDVRAIIDLNDSIILVGTYGSGLWQYNHECGEMSPAPIYNIEEKKSINRIFSFCYDSTSGNIFIGSDGGGLFEYNPFSFHIDQYVHLGYNPYSISNNAVNTILIDRGNNLWAGHFRGGLSFSANRKPFHNIRYNLALSNSLSNSLVNTVIMDSNGELLIGTDGGGLNILKKDGTVENSITGNNTFVKQLPAKSILTFYEDRNNIIWIGTYLDGVYQYSPQKDLVSKFGGAATKIHQLSNDDIRCFFEDRDGKMWIGTNGGGINIYNPHNQEIKVIKRDEEHLDNSLSLDWIHCITEDSYGYIWIGTAFGLNRYDPVNKVFMKFFYDPIDSNSLSNDFVYCILEDSDKNLWIGTSLGLNCFKRSENQFIKYEKEQGLPDNIIYDFEEDADKNLWIITNNGLSKFNLNTHVFSNFDIDDGLLSSTFINGSMYKSSENMIYMGSVKGLSYFNPREIVQNIKNTPFLITDFKIFNRSVPINKEFNGKIILTKHISLTDNIEISYKENVISFEFTALNYSSPNKIKYAYYLENFDKDWNDAENIVRSVTYTDLRPGEYIFRVKTTNMANNVEKSIKINVTPPFYRTIWFKILLILLIVAIIYYWNNNRIIHIKNQKDALEIKIREEQLRHEKEEISLRNETLKSQMNYKNAQLTSFTLLISHKNDIMREIKRKLTAFADQVHSDSLDKELKKLVEAIDKEFKVEADWQRFEEHFNQIHKDFFNRLKEIYPDLSPTYLKLSAYIRMNLSSKEIASLMNISLRGVEKSRSRLRKMMNITQDVNLTIFISNI